MISQSLDSVPFWSVAVLCIATLLACLEAGFRIGRWRKSKGSNEDERLVGSMAASTLGMFAFLLAFTFNMAATRFSDRQKLVLDEANAIMTTYLRAGLLDASMRDPLRSLLHEYVDQRVVAYRTDDIDVAIRRSEELQAQMWQLAKSISKTPSARMIIPQINRVFDLHASRVYVGIEKRIPDPIWSALGAIALLAFFGTGYHLGLSKSSRPLVILPVVLAFSTVILLIIALDRSRSSLFDVNQQPILDVQADIQAWNA